VLSPLLLNLAVHYTVTRLLPLEKKRRNLFTGLKYQGNKAKHRTCIQYKEGKSRQN
jgi:hypothetical protein